MLLSHLYDNLVEAGCDEAGRGCLAGSVYAAAVILPPDYDNPALNDSKKLSVRQRYALREQIEHDALAWAVGVATPEEIDEINILHASFLAMHRALDQLKKRRPLCCWQRIAQCRQATSPHLCHQRRWKISEYSGSQHSCQDLSRRLYDGTS